MGEEREPYIACKATSEEESKIKSSLSKFRAEAKPLLQKFHAGSISFAEMKNAVKKLQTKADSEIHAALGPDRFTVFMDSVTGAATKVKG